MIARWFDDPRHRQSEEIAFRAELAERAGQLDRARGDYEAAARLEEANALDIPHDEAKVRSLLAISAVALWLRSERWSEVARAGCAFLAFPDALTPDARRELQAFVDRAWRSREV